MLIPSVKDLDVQRKRVLVRVDFNVPFDEKGHISDLTRIRASLPTLEFLLKKNASLILLSHRGRPQGKDDSCSLKPCAQALEKLLQRPVLFAPDCLQADKLIERLTPGSVLLLENLRFYPAEEHPNLDPLFAKTLASYGDLYVNDAFAAAHRAHSSIVPIVSYFPKKAAAGFLLEKEMHALAPLLTCPQKPFHILLGGAKVSSKLGVLQALLQRADALYLGGAMAFTFLKALGYLVGSSPVEDDLVPIAKKILDECAARQIPLYLPPDQKTGKSPTDATATTVSLKQGILDGWKGFDIGPQTLHTWASSLQTAHTIFWNGPMGVFENPCFAEGTYQLATLLSKLPSKRIVGGGDSVAAIEHLHLSKKFNHVSTGGGASLEFIEKGSLPGIDALKNC